MLSFKQAFSLSFHLHQEALYFLFAFCHEGGIICILEVVYIFPCNLDSSLADLSDYFLKVAFLHTFIQYLALCTFALKGMIWA